MVSPEGCGAVIKECQRRDIKLFVLPPRSPKLNEAVERAHRTHTEEFYEVTESSLELSELLEWRGHIIPEDLTSTGLDDII